MKKNSVLLVIIACSNYFLTANDSLLKNNEKRKRREATITSVSNASKRKKHTAAKPSAPSVKGPYKSVTFDDRNSPPLPSSFNRWATADWDIKANPLFDMISDKSDSELSTKDTPPIKKLDLEKFKLLPHSKLTIQRRKHQPETYLITAKEDCHYRYSYLDDDGTPSFQDVKLQKGQSFLYVNFIRIEEIKTPK